MKPYELKIVDIALFIVLTLTIVPMSEARKFSYDDARHGINIYYGEIIDIERADTNKRAAQGAMIGGMAGFAYGTHREHHRTKDVLAGALAGALIGAMIDKSKNNSFGYVVRLGDGHSMEVVSENSNGLAIGDCVQIEEGRRTNIRRVSISYCRDEVDEWDVHNSRFQGSLCDRAKEQLLDAQNQEELNFAEQKMHKACH